MEVFGGFMMMVSIIGFFLTVIWFILPFVIFNIKGRVDHTLVLVEQIEKRLAAIELSLQTRETVAREAAVREGSATEAAPPTDHHS
jgi:hypothetical protein